MISVYQMAEITSAMIPSNSSSVKSSSISKRMPWGKNCYGIFVTPMIIVKECNNVNGDEDGKKLAWYFIFWDHPKCVTSDEPLPICVKKPAIKSTSWPSKETTQELLNWFKIFQIMTTSLKNKLTFKNHVHFGHHQQKVFHQPKLVRFTFSICLLSSCSLLSLISPLHLVRQVMDSKFPCWICRRSWDCKASGRECATLSALHCCTVFQCAHVYTTLMCFTLIWSAFQYLCFHRLVLHLTFPSVNWTNYPPPTSQAHSWWDLKYYDVRLVRPKIDTWISPSWVC